MSGPVIFPTMDPECGDAERRSLIKINALQSRISDSLAYLAKPGGGQTALTTYIYGTSYTIPAGADLLDVSCYNPGDNDCWVFIMITPGPASAGQRATFPVRVYAHNHAYYEAMTAAGSVPAGNQFSIAVSSTENSLTWNSVPVYLAIRHA
jgi:hypothetical protein